MSSISLMSAEDRLLEAVEYAAQEGYHAVCPAEILGNAVFHLLNDLQNRVFALAKLPNDQEDSEALRRARTDDAFHVFPMSVERQLATDLAILAA
ncbi:hypothetical protein LTR12_016504 [Friedmanniomyces endolithicus]|nr:hypothetical protein LTR12_016504 [Friedmanniomyces endolithicus]